ncbi:MAG TPA: PAS domain-containing sensor histidine kinase [Gemmataceae bacterium]|nr:PAS domain-containing sensor histidine kinase [Gemmataceae bacterium]
MRGRLRHAPPARRVLWISPLLALLFFLPAPLPASSPAGVRRVLVIYPTSDMQPGNFLFNRGLRHGLDSSPEPVEIYNEYLDTARFPDAEHHRQFAVYLRTKYAECKIDLVVPAMAPSLDFALKYREEAFPGVPMVHAVIEERELGTRRLGAGVVGVPMRIDLVPTLELALRLHPGTRRVAVIAGSSPTDVYWEGRARRAFAPFEATHEFTYLTGLPMDDLLKKVGDLPEGTVIYYLHVQRDGAGEMCTPAEMAGRVADAAHVPVYGHIESYLGRGIVGGRMMSFEAEGNNAAGLALRVLGGEKPEEMSVPGGGDNAYLFDWRQLRRWDVREEALPPGSVVRFREPTPWEEYKGRVLGVVALCVIQAVLLFALLLQWVRRRRAERRFWQVVEAAPGGIILVGPDGRIILANAGTEALFGYRREELVGQKVEVLLPASFRAGHAAPVSRAMGAAKDPCGRRKDGSEFPVEVRMNPMPMAAGLAVLASVTDLAERRRAEESLRESQSELRALTGQLLQAQETERRRVARELHDALSQRLALLAVELDLLARRPPDEEARLVVKAHDLSAQVKELSSLVHDLSHNLHPAKLEQLGLVACVRGLCKEQAAHGLQVEFIHQPIPPLPGDTVLCLYRIAQEALRNVVKHSGARQARVELGGSDGEVSLRIADDGAGFAHDDGDGRGGLGLVSMRERLRLVGGSITIDSRPAAGTRIMVHVPMLPGPPAPEKALQPAPPAI